MIRSFLAVLLLLVYLAASSTAFTVNPRFSQQVSLSSTTRLNGLMDAFKNDETLGKPQNAGLKNGPNYNDNVTINGKPVKGAVVGQKLTVVAGRARVKIPVNCQNGDCGTCMVKFNGRKVRMMRIDVVKLFCFSWWLTAPSVLRCVVWLPAVVCAKSNYCCPSAMHVR